MAITGALTLDQISILEVDADPSVSGAAAPIGSIALLFNGTGFNLWKKIGAADTNWSTMDNPWVDSGGVLQWSDDTGKDLVIRQASNVGSAYLRQVQSRGNLTSPSAVLSGDRLGGEGFYGWNSSGVNSLPSAQILSYATENHTASAQGGNFIIEVIPNGTTTPVTKFTLDQSGNLLLANDLIVGGAADNGLDLLQLPQRGTVNFPIEECFDDFLWTTLGSGTNPFSVVSSVLNGGAVTVEGAATGNNYAGRISASTGTTLNATGHAVIDFFNSVNKIRLGSQRLFFESRVMVPALSTGGVAFTVQIGLQDSNAIGVPTNGVYFTYTHSTNSGQWVCTCRAASTSTSVNSSVAVTANQWYVLRAEIAADRSSVSFYIDGVLIGTTTTNIPAATAGMRPLVQIDKNSNTATASLVWADYVFWKMYR